MLRYAAVMGMGMVPAVLAASRLVLGEAPGADCVAPRLYAPANPPGQGEPAWYAGIAASEPLDARCGVDAAACPVGFFSSRCNEPHEAHYLSLQGRVMQVSRVPGQDGFSGYDGQFQGEGVWMLVEALPGWSVGGDPELHVDTLAVARPVKVSIRYQGQQHIFHALYDDSP